MNEVLRKKLLNILKSAQLSEASLQVDDANQTSDTHRADPKDR